MLPVLFTIQAYADGPDCTGHVFSTANLSMTEKVNECGSNGDNCLLNIGGDTDCKWYGTKPATCDGIKVEATLRSAEDMTDYQAAC